VYINNFIDNTASTGFPKHVYNLTSKAPDPDPAVRIGPFYEEEEEGPAVAQV